MNDRQKYAKVKRNTSKLKFLFSQLIDKFSLFSELTEFFSPSLKKFFVLKEPTCESLSSPFAYSMSLFQCVMSPGREKPTGREKCSQKKLRSVD